jgi:hypothetical protein
MIAFLLLFVFPFHFFMLTYHFWSKNQAKESLPSPKPCCGEGETWLSAAAVLIIQLFGAMPVTV